MLPKLWDDSLVIAPLSQNREALLKSAPVLFLSSSDGSRSASYALYHISSYKWQKERHLIYPAQTRTTSSDLLKQRGVTQTLLAVARSWQVETHCGRAFITRWAHTWHYSNTSPRTKRNREKRLLGKGGAEGRPVASSTLIVLILLNCHMKTKTLKIGNRNREYIITQRYPGRQQMQYYHSAHQVSAQAQALVVLTLTTSGLAETGQTAGDLPEMSDKGTQCENIPIS